MGLAVETALDISDETLETGYADEKADFGLVLRHIAEGIGWGCY